MRKITGNGYTYMEHYQCQGGDILRSCFFVFEEQNRDIVTDLLHSYCDCDESNSHEGKHWNILKNGDGLLYISLHPAEKLFDDIEDKAYFYKLNNMRFPLLCCQIDVSGRYDGTPEIRRLLTQLFIKVKGYAMDEYTDYFWTYNEIYSNAMIEGHRFFDYVGWHEEK
jgi:hypothetical protein